MTTAGGESNPKLTVQQVARIWRVRRITVYRWIKSGLLPANYSDGKPYAPGAPLSRDNPLTVPRDAVRQLMTANSNDKAPTVGAPTPGRGPDPARETGEIG